MLLLTVSGRLTGEPELKKGNNVSFATFAIANNDNKKEPVFIECSSFKDYKFCMEYLKKGSSVVLTGSLRFYNNKPQLFVDHIQSFKNSNNL